MLETEIAAETVERSPADRRVQGQADNGSQVDLSAGP